MADAEAAAARVKDGLSFAALAAERGLNRQGHRSRHLGEIRRRRPGRRRCRLCAQGRRGQRAGPGALRRGHRHRARRSSRKRASRSPSWRRRSATTSPSSAPSRTCKRLHDKIEDERAGGAALATGGGEAEAAGRHLSTSIAPAASRAASRRHLPAASQVVSAAFDSDVGVDNDPVEADGGYVWYNVASYHAGARSHPRRSQGSGRSALARGRNRVTAEGQVGRARRQAESRHAV